MTDYRSLWQKPYARVVAKIVIAAAILSFTILHSAVIFIYNAPPNPISVALDRPLDNYVNPLLMQRWSFFAPTPINKDITLMARGKFEDNTFSPWLSVTGVLVDAIHKNRFTPYAYVLNSVINGVNGALADKTLETTDRNVLTRRIESSFSLQIALRTSAAMLESRYPDKRLRSVQMHIEVAEFPRFTHRFDPRASTIISTITLPDRPVKHVATLR